MATVTVGKAYFQALLQKAEIQTSTHDLDSGPSLLDTVVISKAEHEYLFQAAQEYNLLKKALFRGGLANDTLETLLEGEGRLSAEPALPYDYNTETRLNQKGQASGGRHSAHTNAISPASDNSANGHTFHRSTKYRNTGSETFPCHRRDSTIDNSTVRDDDYNKDSCNTAVHEQRTLFVTNLSENTTYKDLTTVIRGGRLLEVIIRKDRSATISFLEGSADFLAYSKRNDIYLHTKRLEFRWADRQFTIPNHISNRIAHGATRNLIVRGIAGKLTADQIRDHLDHIHNLIVIDIHFSNGDAFISTNSIHNALFARTCMMSRTVYKGSRVVFGTDECAASLPRSTKACPPAPATPLKPKPTSNIYALLDNESDASESEESYVTDDYLVAHHRRHHWDEATVD